MFEQDEKLCYVSLHSLVVLVGEEGRVWYLLPVDQVEWTEPYYGHQN